MNDFAFALVYVALIFVYLCFFVGIIRKGKKIPGAFMFGLMILMNIIRASIETAAHLLPNLETAKIVYPFVFAPIFLFPVFNLFFLLNYLHMVRFTNKKTLLFVSVFPLTVAVLAATNQYHSQFLANTSYYSSGDLRLVFYDNTILLVAIYIYLFVLFAASIFIILTRFKNMPTFFHNSMWMFFAGTVIYLLTYFARVLEWVQGAFDAPLIVAVFPAILYYYALFHTQGTEMLSLARDSVFQELTHAVLVLDSRNVIVDANKQSIQMSEHAKVPIIGIYLQHVLQGLMQIPGAQYDEHSKVLDFPYNGVLKHYHVPIKSICDKRGDVLGSFVEIIDVTEQYHLINDLAEIASRDPMTNLLNRRSFDDRMKVVDVIENIPIAILFGDVNGLKYANDTFGHEAGDRLLKSIASVLTLSCPGAACISRFGGDEFVVLLTRADQKKAEEYIQQINKNCSNVCDEEFGCPSISFGIAIKTNTSQRLIDLLEQADNEMYIRKKASKLSREQRPG